MKKLLCVALSLVLLVTAAITAVPASADGGGDTLTVSVNGTSATEIAVGNEFIVRVGLYAGDEKILNGQVHMEYDSDCLFFVPYDEEDKYDPTPENYCFPESIAKKGGVVFNNTVPGTLNYNFTKAKGIDVFNDPSKLFARFRFKATAAGTTDISYIIQYMINISEQRIYYREQALAPVNPYTVITIEPSEGCIGDADGDYELTILDATYAQRVAAGADLTYDADMADLTGDKALSLKDAVIMRRYLAGKSVSDEVGSYIFASEKVLIS